MGGSSGASGSITFPGYIEDIHRDWLTDKVTMKTVEEVLRTSQEYNPYTPFLGQSTFDDLERSKLRATEYKNAVDDLQYDSSWSSIVDHAIGKIGHTGLLKSINVPALIQAARQGAGDTGELFRNEISQIAEREDWAGIISRASSSLNSVTVPSVKIKEAVNEALKDTSTAMARFLEDSVMEADEVDDWDAFVQRAIQLVDTDGVLQNVDTSEIVHAARTGAADAVKSAVQAALSSVDGPIIEQAVAAYRQRRSLDRARSVRSFAAGMSDAGATNSSAFMIGMAMIQAQHDLDVANYDKELSLSLYQQAMSAHVEAYMRQLQAELTAAIGGKESREAFILGSTQSLIGMREGRLTYQQMVLQTKAGLHQMILQSRASAAQLDKSNKDQMLQAGADQMIALRQTQAQIQTNLAQMILQSFSMALDSHMRSQLQDKVNRDGFIADSVRVMLGILGSQIDHRGRLMASYTEQDRIGYVIRGEKAGFQADIATRYYMWDMQMFERATNILGGPGGMAGFVPPTPSRVASALGGAFTGAAAGAQVGGTPGAAVGGILGGIAGLIQ